MNDRQRYESEGDLGVWRGMFFGILFGGAMWAVILYLLWLWLF